MIRAGQATHRGMKRPNNEDSFRVLVGREAPAGVEAMAVVADGMGGHRSGEVASAIAVDTVVKRLVAGPPCGRVQGGGGYQAALAAAVEEADREVRRRGAGSPDLEGMGTTCTVVAARGHSLYVAHVGDSRAYLLRDGALRRLTRDHTVLAEHGGDAEVSPEARRRSPLGHLLTRSLGAGPDPEVDTRRLALRPGDVVLLCSDGLHSMVTDSQIAEVLRAEAPQGAADRLVRRANDAGGDDNVTAVVLRIESLEATSVTRSATVESAAAPTPQAPVHVVRSALWALRDRFRRRR